MKEKAAQKLQAIALRKQGKSVPEIATLLQVAKSSVSVWVRNVPLSAIAEKRLLRKISAGQLAGGRSRHTERLAREKEHYDAALQILSTLVLSKEHQALLCSLIYWCEGAKSTNCVDFTNADPNLVRTFLYLFRSSFTVDEAKFRVCLHIHDYHTAKKQISVWSQITKIPGPQFSKPYLKPHTGKQIREDYQGCVSIRYFDTDIARQLHAKAKASFTLLK